MPQPLGASASEPKPLHVERRASNPFANASRALPVSLDLEQLVQEHLPRLYRAALLLCGDPWEADDLAQEVFLVAARDPDRFQGRSAPYTWLYGILLNLSRRRHRKTRLHRRKLQVLQEERSQRQPQSVSAPLEQQEFQGTLWALVDRLPEAQRQAVVLRFGQQLKYEEIAQIMGCPLGTVKSRLYHALRTLRGWMEAEEQEEGTPSRPATGERSRAV